MQINKINKINSFPIINSLDLIKTDENGMSSFMPALNEQVYDMQGAGKTFISYGDDTERLNYFPTSVEGGNCDFVAPNQECRLNDIGHSFLSWLYGDMKNFNGYPAGYGGFSEPLILRTPGSSTLKPYFSFNESFNKVKAISDGSEVNTAFKVIGISHNLNQLPFGKTIDGDKLAPDTCFVLNSPISEIQYTGGTNLNSSTGEVPFFADPENGIAIGVIENINCEISYTEWVEDLGYLIKKVPVTFTIFYKTELFLTIPRHSVVNNFLDYDLNINTSVFGNGSGNINFNIPNQVIKKHGDRFEIATSFGDQFPSVYYAGEKSLLAAKIYFYSPDDNEAFNSIVADKFNIYPFSNGAVVNNSILVINRRSLEAIDPTNTQGDGLDEFEFDLEIDNTYADSIFCCSDMAYTVLGGVKSQGKDLIIFALRDGAGFYTCDISEFIPLGNEIINFSYENGIIYIGHLDDTGAINYKLLIPDLPLARFEKVTYEFKKLGISFIPCQTHCMAKGGIVSKIY